MIKIEMLCVGMFQSNCVFAWCERTKQGIICDAGDEAGRILDFIKARNLDIQAVVNTHAHVDHVSALADVVDALKVPVMMHRDEMPGYESVPQQALAFGLPAARLVDIDRFLQAGDEISFGDVTGKVIHTPGHTPGGICLVFAAETPPRVIAADTLFQGSIGRTDLPGGDYDAIIRTLKTEFVPLPDNMIVYPGHGPATTIGDEKQFNPFLAPLAQSGS